MVASWFKSLRVKRELLKVAIGLKRQRVHVLYENLKGGEGQLLFVFLIGWGNYRGCNSWMIELRFGDHSLQGALQKSHTRMAFHYCFSNAIFAVQLHPWVPFPFAVIFSRDFYIGDVFRCFIEEHLVSMAFFFCITRRRVFFFFVKILKGYFSLLFFFFFGVELFFTPNWIQKITHTQKKSMCAYSLFSPWEIWCCHHTMALSFSHSHSIEAFWCHGNSRRRRCFSWHSSRWLTLHAVSLLYLYHLG